jgi:gluconolactonase
VCAEGGVVVLEADGRRLGELDLPERPDGLAWGGADRRELYLCAQTGVYRLRTSVPGADPASRTPA